MRQAAGLIAASLLLVGCTTSVLETRHPSPAGQLWGGRTLVVADVGEPYRATTEDAIARQLPGAVAAHDLIANSEGSTVWSPLFAPDLEEAFVWDTLVRVSVSAEGSSCLPHSACGWGDDGFPDTFGVYVHVDLDVSVFRTADRREVYGVKVRSEVGAAGIEDPEQLAPSAAARAGRKLAASGLFD